MQLSRKIIIVAVAAAVVVAIIYGFMSKSVLVDTVAVSYGPLSVTIEEEGKTRVIDRFVISVPVTGFARRIELNVGDPVAKGQLLAELEPRRSRVLDPRSRAEAEARVAAAGAALSSAKENRAAAKADADYASAELERARKLFDAGFASKDTLERAEAEARHRGATRRSADFAVEVARFELEAAKTALKFTAWEGDSAESVTIHAPVAGRILKLHRESEGVVTEGQPLIEIGDPRALEIEVDLLSEDAVRIGAGTKVLFDRWGGDLPLDGVVRVVEPVGFTKVSALGVEEQRVLVITDITSPPEQWAGLGDGYRVEALFTLWEGDNILQVPASALFRYGDGWALFVVDGKRARRKVVEIGHRNGLTAEIVSGLTEGESVITHPDEAMEDGSRVRLR
ncbi:MAG: efflux RND transporter periplasmic adaptor subunit [Thermodesulfobacteriota bacterium]